MNQGAYIRELKLVIPDSKTHGPLLGHFQVGSYRYRSLTEGLYTL